MDRLDNVMLKLDESIQAAQKNLDKIDQTMESLRDIEEYEDHFNAAYEDMIEARLELIKFERMKQYILQALDSATTNGGAPG